MHNYVPRRISQFPIFIFNCLFDISSWIPHRHLKLNIVQNGTIKLPIWDSTILYQLSCSIVQSHSDNSRWWTSWKQGCCKPNTRYGARDRKALMIYLKEYKLPSQFTPINHYDLPSLPLKCMSKSVHSLSLFASILVQAPSFVTWISAIASWAALPACIVVSQARLPAVRVVFVGNI